MDMVEFLMSVNLPLTGTIRISQGMSRNEIDNWEEMQTYVKGVEYGGTRRNV